MPHEIALRGARPGDAPSLSVLLAQLGYPAAAEEIPERLMALAKFPKALALVAVDGENVVGLMTAHIIPAIHANEPVALLTTLVVAESHRGRGIGSRLVAEAEGWGAGQGAVRLSVTSGLQRVDSHQFYEQRNYQRSGFRFTKALMLGAVMGVSIAGAQNPAPVAASQNPPSPAASQNPSPMVEATRAHGRLAPRELGGAVRSFAGPATRPVELWIPDRASTSNAVDLVVHFHGAAWLPQQAVAGLGTRTVAAVVNLGAGSGGYHRAFADPTAFDSLLAGVAREVSGAIGRPVRIGRVTLVGFSAGHGAIRAILLDRRHFARVDAVLLLDGMHTSYVPDGKVLDKGGAIDTTNLTAFAELARAAMRGEKQFIVTHSEIFPGTFASTTETADWLLRALALRRTPVLRWGPRGMQQLSEVRMGRFELLGFAGNSAPDHVDHLHAMPEFLGRTTGRAGQVCDRVPERRLPLLGNRGALLLQCRDTVSQAPESGSAEDLERNASFATVFMLRAVPVLAAGIFSFDRAMFSP